MIPKWRYWIAPTLLASPWLIFLVLHTINPSPPSEDWRLLLVFLALGTYGLFLVPYWIVVAIRRRQWGFLVPLVIVNVFWIGRAVADRISSHDPDGVGAYALSGIIATYMLTSSLIVGVIYIATRSLTTYWGVLSRSRAKPPV